MIKGGHLDTWCPSPSHWSLIRSASLISSISDHTNSNVKTKGKGCFYLMTENEPLTLHLWAEATVITALILGVTDCPHDWSLQTAVVHQPLFVWLTLCGFIMMSTPVNSWGMRALTKPLYVNSWAPEHQSSVVIFKRILVVCLDRVYLYTHSEDVTLLRSLKLSSVLVKWSVRVLPVRVCVFPNTVWIMQVYYHWLKTNINGYKWLLMNIAKY